MGLAVSRMPQGVHVLYHYSDTAVAYVSAMMNGLS